MRRIYQYRLLLSTLLRPISSSAPAPRKPLILPRTRTPFENQFESWVTKLKPGFSHSDVDEALRAQYDADLALDIFRWTAQRPNYKHNHQTYLTIFQICASQKRDKAAETLVEEILAGACAPNLDLCNYMIDYCCSRKSLSRRAFDVYKKMLQSSDCKPNLDTYSMLFDSLLHRFGNLTVNYVHLNSVKSLANQMKACGVIPNTFIMNSIITAYSKCLIVDEAVRVLREMGLHGCQPNAHSYNSLIKALCQAEMVDRAHDFYKEVKEKCLILNPTVYKIFICSLAMEKRFGDAVEVTFHMLESSVSPDFLTYQTVLDEMCRDGREDEAFDVVEQFKKRDVLMDEKIYSDLLNIMNTYSS